MNKKVGLFLGVFLATAIFGILLPALPVRAQQEGGIVTFAWLEDVDDMNPWTADSVWEAYTQAAIWDALWDTNPDDISVDPWLCHTWVQVDLVGMEWECSIYDNVKFSDGTDLDINDIVFAYYFAKYAVTRNTVIHNTYVDSCTKLNDTAFKLVLTEPYAPFPRGLDLLVVKASDWSSYVVNWGGSVASTPEPWIIDNAALIAEDLLGAGDTLIGTGGFEWIQRIPGQFIELDAVDDYWNQDFQPHVDKIVLKIISNPAAQLLAVKTGEVDAMGWWVPPAQVAGLQDHPVVGLIQTPDCGYYHLSFNFRFWPMNLTSFRHAVRAMVDNHQIVDGFMLGNGIPGGSNVPPLLSYWYYNYSLDDYPFMDWDENETVARAELTAGGWYDTNGNGKFDTWFNGTHGPISFATLGNGTEWPSGITILAPSYDPVRVRACMMITEALDRLFDVDFIPEIPDFNTLVIRAFYSNTFDMFILGYGLGFDPGTFLKGIFHSSSYGFLGADNCFPILNDTLDTAIDYYMNTTGDSVQNGKTRQQWGWEVQKILIEQGPQYVLFYRVNYQAYRKDLIGGLVDMPSGWHSTQRSFYNVYRVAAVSAIPTGPAYTWYIVGGAVAVGVIGIALVARSNAAFTAEIKEK
ncbi:MAG: ABC transporter substrate-binding protein [Promethearchaeota archaeon]